MPVAPPAHALRRRELEHPARTLPRPGERVEEIGHVLRRVVDLGMPGGDDQNGPVGGARETRDDQPARSAPEPAGRQTQLSLGEGVGEVLERPPASQCGGLIGHANYGLAENTSKGPRREYIKGGRGANRALPERLSPSSQFTIIVLNPQPERIPMASIREEIVVEVSPAKVWAVVRDVGAIHQRLVRGFVTDCRLEGEARIVTFANGLVVRELIVDVDDGARRLVWSATGGTLTHHNASLQIFAEVGNHSRLVWIADLHPK